MLGPLRLGTGGAACLFASGLLRAAPAPETVLVDEPDERCPAWPACTTSWAWPPKPSMSCWPCASAWWSLQAQLAREARPHPAAGELFARTGPLEEL